MSTSPHRLWLLLLCSLCAACATGNLEDPADQGATAEDMRGEETPAADMLAADMRTQDMRPPAQDMRDMSRQDMAQDMTPEQDMTPALDMAPPDMNMEPCQGLCTPKEVCRAEVCVDLCVERAAQCGAIMEQGPPIACGECGSGQTCIANACVDACAEASNECGEFVWSGADASCAAGCASGESCAQNQCASAGWRIVGAGRRHTCATRSDGSVRCWGDNLNGQLGTLQAGDDSYSPVVVSGLGQIRDLSSKDRHTCAVDNNARLWCWGFNNDGQVGDEQPAAARKTPYRHPTLTGVAEVGAGTLHTCVRLEDESVRCVGFNSQGQLGSGSITSSYAYVSTKNISSAVSLSAGVAHSCVVERNGRALCWGLNGTTENFGRLGTGTTPSRTTPTDVVQLGGIRQLSAGQDHTCAVTQSGEVWCWGDNTFGQLGDGGSVDSLTPRKVTSMTGAVAISVGGDHTCALNTSRRLFCWGRNDYGQLGLGHVNVQRTPQQVPSIASVLSVDAGLEHTCASTTTGQLFCWGRNDHGQLGQGNTSDSSQPLIVN